MTATYSTKLFNWSCDGWQDGLPPKSGNFRVRWGRGAAHGTSATVALVRSKAINRLTRERLWIIRDLEFVRYGP